MISNLKEIPIYINLDTRLIDKNNDLIQYTTLLGDTTAENIIFYCSKTFDGVDLSQFDGAINPRDICQIHYENSNGDKYIAKGEISTFTPASDEIKEYLIEHNDYDETQDYIQIIWTVSSDATKYVGKTLFTIKFLSYDEDDKITYQLDTKINSITIEDCIQAYNDEINIDINSYQKILSILGIALDNPGNFVTYGQVTSAIENYDNTVLYNKYISKSYLDNYATISQLNAVDSKIGEINDALTEIIGGE